MKKRKNPLSLWSFSYRKTYYLSHPWKWFHNIYSNIRNFIHRGRYGFAYVDAWNFCDWWAMVGAEALRYMRDHGCGYPGFDQWDTPEKWKAYLTEMADNLQWSAASVDPLYDTLNKTRNQYKYIEDDKKRAEIFAEIGKNLGRFWD